MLLIEEKEELKMKMLKKMDMKVMIHLLKRSLVLFGLLIFIESLLLLLINWGLRKLCLKGFLI